MASHWEVYPELAARNDAESAWYRAKARDSLTWHATKSQRNCWYGQKYCGLQTKTHPCKHFLFGFVGLIYAHTDVRD